MKNYISRHRNQNTAQKKCQKEALKQDRNLFPLDDKACVVSDNKWLYVVSDPDQHEIIYEYSPEPHVCQHTGLKIPRNRKNHAKVSSLLKEAYQSNAPRASHAVKLALWAGRDEQGFTTIEEFISYGQEILKKEEEQYEKQRATWSADKRLSVRRRLEKEAKRKEKNQWLRAHGYHWRKKEIEVEEKWGPSTYQRWQLYAPDGREVSVAQATLEIEPQSQPNQDEKAKKGAHEQATREYSAFRAKHLTGLSMSHAYPSGSIEWEQIAYFDPGTPGAFITGDTWYVGQIDGEVVYRRSHGYATEIYAPQSIIDTLVEENYSERMRRDGKIKAARWVIERQGQGCIGDDIADRLIELRGIQYFARVAGLDRSLMVKEIEEVEDVDNLPF